MRDKRNLSTEFVESIVSVHNVSNYINASFTSGKLLCISFERNDGTLGELMKLESDAQAQSVWLSKCQNMLKDIASCLDHLHTKSLVHGCVDMDSVAQFGRTWKLLDVGSSTVMGDAMSGSLRKSAPPESLSGLQKASTAVDTRGRSGSRSRMNKRSSSKARAENSVATSKDLPPLSGNKAKTERKKFGIFVFGLKDLGLGNYGAKKGSKARGAVNGGDQSIGGDTMDSSIASSQADQSGATDEGSLRVIAMQEDEIARLRKALEEKEHIYRHQLAEERASFKRQEVERQRELQKKHAQEKAKVELPRFVPEKVMASALWDVWCFGLIMAEAIIGKSPLLPSSADTDDDFLDKLSKFNDVQLSVSEPINHPFIILS